MTACNYINTLYTQIIQSYEGINIDFDILDEAITTDVVTAIINPVITNSTSSSCTLDVERNACNINITIL